MGQVLPVFAHCKEAPSTASSTPDSTEGGNDDSDFRELHTAREFSEDEEEETTSQDWGTPRELTFSYIAFDGLVGSGTRRDSVARRSRPQGRSVSEPRDPPPQLSLGDSLESIPSLSQSPELARRGDTAPQIERPLEDLQLQLDQLGWATREVGSGEDSSTSSSTPLEDEEPEGPEAQESGKELDLQVGLARSSPPKVLTPQPSPSSGTPQVGTPSPPGSQDSHSWPDEPLEEEEEAPWRQDREPFTGQCFDRTGQSEFASGLHLLVADLLYWKDARTSGAVFTGLMVSLLCLLHFSIVSVAAHVALLLLCATISLRVHRKVLRAVRRGGNGTNPFQAYLDVDLTLTREQTEHLSRQITSWVVSSATQLRHFFLVEDLVDSLKLALLFYILTFVGAIFNGLTLLILGVIGLFTIPLLYRQHQAQIDQYVGLVTNQLSHIKAKIRAKIPGTGALASAAAAVSGSKAKAE